MERLDAAPKIMLDFIQRYGDEVKVCEIKEIDIDGKKFRERSSYDSRNKTIRMDESKDNSEYIKALYHELGHFADDILGRISLNEDFENAMEADKYWTNNSTEQGNKNFLQMIIDLEKYDVMDNMYISDILSGVFFNDTKIIEAYENSGMSFYGHDNNTYWFAWEVEDKIVQREAFANLFAVYASGDNASCKFIEKWFPNTASRFKKEIEAKIYGRKNF